MLRRVVIVIINDNNFRKNQGLSPRQMKLEYIIYYTNRVDKPKRKFEIKKNEKSLKKEILIVVSLNKAKE